MATDKPTTADLIRTQLRRMRTAAGLSQEEFGKRAHYSASMVSAVELGQRPLDAAYLARADEVLGTGDLFVRLLELAKRDGEPLWFRPWLDAERRATQLRCFHPTLIPGLLQTANYARALFRGDTSLTEERIEQLVAARLERQTILDRAEPPQFTTVIDEAALDRFAEECAGILARWESVRNEALPRRQSIELIKELVRPWI
ncbi:hypothetical protein GCM10027280_32110 [Micromonospora polyrhachis]|uniref:Transcriptional regulator with XRE-family HTH domain n=1 Tax=Micromonospora polyrhachis TaxID=1282883 RepID=A0A7W7STW6_9ACTN|nr:transcriptional regulator with XRE-family HTH domain [Micromonospora polyrhachis]